MDKERTFHKLSNDDLKEVSGGQTIGEWQMEQRRKMQMQNGPANQVMVGQGQNSQEEFGGKIGVYCKPCNKVYYVDPNVNDYYCDKGHLIMIRG